MIEEYRKNINSEFTKNSYNNLVKGIETEYNCKIPFHISEMPILVSQKIKNDLLNASNEIIDFLVSDSFNDLNLPKNIISRIGNNNIGKPTCLAFDYAISKINGKQTCRLIEFQAGVYLYGFTELLALKYRDTYSTLLGLTHYLSDLSSKKYKNLLKKEFLAEHSAENVIFLEIEPKKQQNRIDHLYLEKEIGIKTICMSDVIVEDGNAFYQNGDKKTPITKIINRVIIDELESHPELNQNFFTQNINVEWSCHPYWFFKISKALMPYLKGEYFPQSLFLDKVELENIDLNNFVLKPCFSVAGKGVNLNATKKDINAINPIDKQNYILQQKVDYDFCVNQLNDSVRAEIRIMYIWEHDKKRPIPVIAFARSSKGDKMALRYNHDFGEGATTCFFE